MALGGCVDLRGWTTTRDNRFRPVRPDQADDGNDHFLEQHVVGQSKPRSAAAATGTATWIATPAEAASSERSRAPVEAFAVDREFRRRRIGLCSYLFEHRDRRSLRVDPGFGVAIGVFPLTAPPGVVGL